MTTLNASQCLQEVSSLATRLRQLQFANKQLEESLNLQIQFLSIHMQVDGIQNKHIKPVLVKQIQQQHANMHQLHSQKLIASQIKIQEEREMNELIKNYEARIMELQLILISKEAEMAEATEDQGNNETLPRKENLRKLNLQCIQKNSINKAIQDIKKLSVEIDALSYSLKLHKTSKNKENLAQRKSKEDKPEQKNALTIKERINNMHGDKLLMKVYEVLKQEITKEDELRSELNSLKQDWDQATKTHKQLAKKYKKQEGQKTRLIIGSKKNCCDEQELNFLEELQRAENESAKDGTLFHRVDLNIEKQQKGKAERKRPMSKERHKVSKEN